MPTPLETRRALKLVTGSAVTSALRLLALPGTPNVQRGLLLEQIPELIGLYTDGSSALAADFYEDERNLAQAVGRYTPELVIVDRGEQIGRGIAWSTEPLFSGEVALAETRLAQVVQLQVARPFRDTVTANTAQDPASVGWKRITVGGCKFCRLLASRGAVYKEATARFAAHPSCSCTAAPVFSSTGETGPEADVMQYVASQRSRTPQQQQQLRDYLASIPN